MKIFLAVLLFFGYSYSAAQPQFELSVNVYRSPYASTETYGVAQDIFTHNPLGRYDLRAQGDDDCDSHDIVAAAEGIVRMVVENNDTSCSSGCGVFNNYVWIEHANGEWTKYTHFKKNSVQVSVNQQVCAGTVLGKECAIGATSPANFRHLHFECRRPNNPVDPPIDTAGGFLDAADGAHLIPVINAVNKHFWEQGDVIDASGSSTCTSSSVLFLFPVTTADDGVRIYMATNAISNNPGIAVVYQDGSNGMFHAGSSVTLSPGFHAQSGSYFHARIGTCATTNYPGTCTN